MENLVVVKIGGNVIDDEVAIAQFLTDFTAFKGHKIVVHGGGKLATELSAQLGIATQMVDGRRITDKETVKVVTMVYAGWINKSMVARLQAMGCKAVGLCGADAAILPAVKRPVKDLDYGWVGDIIGELINVNFLHALLQSGSSLVIAPITCNAAGDLLNINADTVATELAQAMSKLYNTRLIYCFEKKGLLGDINNPRSVIGEISEASIALLKQQGVIAKGMLPKIDNALNASKNGVKTVMIGDASDFLQLATNETGYGTRVTV